jgi:hypothetical protein
MHIRNPRADYETALADELRDIILGNGGFDMAKKVDKRKLGALARWLEAGAPERDGVKQFDMSSFEEPHCCQTEEERRGKPECGSACCMAGAVVHFWGNVNKARAALYSSSPNGWMGQAPNILGLTDYDANGLFLEYGAIQNYQDTKHAARVVRKFIATGEVDWEGTQAKTRRR